MNETMKLVTPVIRENRRRFEEFCLSLSPDELARPVPGSTWIVQDFASHLSSLDTLFDGYMTTIQSGGQFSMIRDADGAPFDLDAWNNAHVAERRDWTMRQILDEAGTNREQLIVAMGQLDEDQVARPMHFSDPKRGSADIPLNAFLIGWAQHDPIHAADMIKAMPERAEDPMLKAWMANPFVTAYQRSMSGAPKA